MRIAQVCPRYPPYIGGVETHVSEISGRLARAGHEVTVITTDPAGRYPPESVIDGVRVLRFPAFAPGDAYYFSSALYRHMKKSRDYDVVHVHGYHAFPALLASGTKAPMFVFTPHYHGKGHTPLRNLLLKPYRLAGSRVFRRADSVICVSEFEKGLVCRDFGCDGRVKVIPNGVVKREFAGLKPAGKEKVILYVGRLEQYKGVQYAIRALRELPDYRLQIVGKGPYKEALAKEASDMGVSDRTEFLSGLTREELLRCYGSATVTIMLSKYEAYGITVAEALTAGVPTIVANGSALTEFVDGRLCRSVDLPVAPELLADMIRKAERVPYAKEILDWDDVVRRLLAVYQEG
ncbi:glycosyltransferase family 4 protein [Methanocella arvoryzae]|uniref:Glycosyltransferase (Group 1) n=1 Tax=Methanocella arvoryzae (strain DSM 22066 / NBRC 105507 / MRE50) TaxID=351160 RepID=Q0W815_METAR|nr:glycosyltransferase family 4 protein [Methanocella arvoryzae]CAJ35478.1 glycosyltransferase (group 1) [Methanocella arvoryzae MRE50]